MTAPLYLKGYSDIQVKKSLLELDEYIATKIQHGTRNEKEERAKYRKELTKHLLKELSTIS